MYIYQDDKLYIQSGDKLVGVDLYPHKVIKIKGTETKLGDKYKVLTPFEVRCKFQLEYGNCYIFPRNIIGKLPEKPKVVNKPIVKKEVKEEVVINDTTPKAKTTTRRTKRK